MAKNGEGRRSVTIVNRCQSSAGRSFVNLLESLDILEKAAFNASSSGSNSSALAFICHRGITWVRLVDLWGFDSQRTEEIVSLAAISS